MSHEERKITTVVRRYGSTITVQELQVNNDPVVRLGVVRWDDRRTRQIAKRHWVEKRKLYWCSGGDYLDSVTIKTPGKLERNLRKEVR